MGEAINFSKGVSSSSGKNIWPSTLQNRQGKGQGNPWPIEHIYQQHGIFAIA